MTPEEAALDVALRLEQDPAAMMKTAGLLLVAIASNRKVGGNVRAAINNAHVSTRYALHAFTAPPADPPTPHG